MFVNPPSGLGRFLLGVLLISTLSYLVLNLVSFGGTSWISYTDVPIRFGLWRVCDTTRSGLCNQWADDQFKSDITNNTFPSGKPGFVRSSQALEIISLIFYIIAAVLIVIGLFDLDGLPYEILFLVAAGLLFICIIFLSASLGLMSDQGRNNHPAAFLDWAWWNGLVGLIFTIITFITLLAFLADMNVQKTSFFNRGQKTAPTGISYGGESSFASPPPPPMINPYPSWDPSPPSGLLSYGNAWNIPSTSFENNVGGGGVSSPVISGLARTLVLRLHDNQYEQELLQPYQQYIQTQQPAFLPQNYYL